jgi:hypothetical protein
VGNEPWAATNISFSMDILLLHRLFVGKVMEELRKKYLAFKVNPLTRNFALSSRVLIEIRKTVDSLSETDDGCFTHFTLYYFYSSDLLEYVGFSGPLCALDPDS